MKEIDKAEMLRGAELFSPLSERSIEQLVAGSQLSSYGPDSHIACAGEYSRGILLIRSGLVKLSIYSQHGQEKVIAMLGEGKTFGQAEILSCRPLLYDARSISRVELLTVGCDTVHKVSRIDARFGLALAQCLSHQFDALVRDIKYASGYSVLQRVASFLLYRAAEQTGTEALVELPFTKSVLASRLGMAPESFSRALRRLQDRKLVTAKARWIRVHDMEALSNVLSHSPRGDISMRRSSGNAPDTVSAARRHQVFADGG
ncbi:MAG: hypothetical protein CMK32_03795 [Porticoccaceae bacterium]|nr:hypothetical protein [Porticoccaceae bacterium]